MTIEKTKSIARGIADKIEATTDIDDWAEFWGFTRDDYEEFLEMPIKLLEREPKTGHWILVSEGTPKENETVIASTKYGVYPEARYSKEYGWEWAYEAGADYWRELEDVEAWMPLPKSYEPQESEE